MFDVEEEDTEEERIVIWKAASSWQMEKSSLWGIEGH